MGRTGSLATAPRGRHRDPDGDEPPDAGWTVLHLIEETACHRGHLEIARERLDGPPAFVGVSAAGPPGPGLRLSIRTVRWHPCPEGETVAGDCERPVAFPAPPSSVGTVAGPARIEPLARRW